MCQPDSTAQGGRQYTIYAVDGALWLMGTNSNCRVVRCHRASSSVSFLCWTPSGCSSTMCFRCSCCTSTVCLLLWQGAPTAKGCGLVTMGSNDEAAAAIDALDNKHTWEGMEAPMVVKWMDAALQKRRREEHLAAMRQGLVPSMGKWYLW